MDFKQIKTTLVSLDIIFLWYHKICFPIDFIPFTTEPNFPRHIGENLYWKIY